MTREPWREPGRWQEVRKIRGKRKDEHIELAVRIPDGPCTNGFEQVHLINNSLPEMGMEDIELGTSFLGKKMALPFIINALTGGTEQAGNINRALSLMAARYGLTMAVGSQTIAIEDPRLQNTFSVVREVNPTGIIFANVAVSSNLDAVLKAVNMIDADAVQLHFNIPQELAMQEGERSFRNILPGVKRIIEASPVPVIAKEVGFGFSRETIKKLYDCGVTIFDIGGKGGTNFLNIEDRRSGMFQGELDEWGIPTAVSLAEAVALDLPIKIIASGGIRSVLDAAKSFAIGADLVGMAGSLLKILVHDGIDELDQRIAQMVYRFQSVLLMTGSRNINDLKSVPVVITGETGEWLKARGIATERWSLRP